MTQYDWSTELNRLFEQVGAVKENVRQCLSQVYGQRGLEWNDLVVKNLIGDIHTRCLAAFMQREFSQNGVQTVISYEAILSPTKCRADILINNRIDIESKAQGIFSLSDLRERWNRLNEMVPNKEHVLVSWRHNLSYIEKIREFMPSSHHYYFHILNTGENQPSELERLINNVLNWLR